jgi:MFS superfamily sulfate permease-like transporter
VLRSLTPGLNHLTKRYSRRWLRADSIAGVTVAAYLIPQVMAYSAIVNVPPVASLWAALAAIVACAMQLAHPALRTRVHDRPDDRRGDCPAGRAEP